MKRKITLTALRKKYPHPRRACEATGADLEDDYCVGGSLCMELCLPLHHFPVGNELIKAIEMATNHEVDCSAMTDAEYDQFMMKLRAVTEFNDEGNFKMVWKALGQLLRWPATAER